MKTNHQRAFKDKFRNYSASINIRSKTTLDVECVLADHSVRPKHPGYEWINGHRGKARAKLGMKKFVRTRVRFHENSALKKLAGEI